MIPETLSGAWGGRGYIRCTIKKPQAGGKRRNTWSFQTHAKRGGVTKLGKSCPQENEEKKGNFGEKLRVVQGKIGWE